jgi:hypothetical protein
MVHLWGLPLCRPDEGRDHIGGGDGLSDQAIKSAGAAVHRPGVVSCKGDNRRVLIGTWLVSNSMKGAVAIQNRHVKIDQNDIERRFSRHCDDFRPIHSLGHLSAELLKEGASQITVRGVVVGDQDTDT